MRPLPIPALPVPSGAAPRPAAPAPLPEPPLLRIAPVEEMGRGSRHLLSLGVLALHGVVVWAVIQGHGEIASPPPPAPLMVQWIAPPAPEQAAPPPPKPRPPTPTPTPPRQVISAPPTPRSESPSFTAPPPAPEPVATVAEAAPSPTPPAPPAPAPVAPPAAPKQLPSSAIQYLVPPQIVYPPAAKRMGETGTVLVRLVVTAQGLPREVVVHKSSGFPRLDEQALRALRAARFKPYLEQGQALEWTAIAPVDFSLD